MTISAEKVCTCYVIDLKHWVTEVNSVDPGTATVANPDCPKHFTQAQYPTR